MRCPRLTIFKDFELCPRLTIFKNFVRCPRLTIFKDFELCPRLTIFKNFVRCQRFSYIAETTSRTLREDASCALVISVCYFYGRNKKRIICFVCNLISDVYFLVTFILFIRFILLVRCNTRSNKSNVPTRIRFREVVLY